MRRRQPQRRRHVDRRTAVPTAEDPFTVLFRGFYRKGEKRMGTGQLRPTGRFRTRFGCRVPGELSQTVSATFAVT